MKSKLQQLREAIIKEIPEIKGKRLVDCPSCSGMGRLESHSADLDSTMSTIDCFECSGSGRQVEEYQIRPITLADVLRVLDRTDYYYSINSNGFFMTYSSDGLYEGVRIDKSRIQWNLSKNLDDQSKETINFLVKIILKK